MRKRAIFSTFDGVKRKSSEIALLGVPGSKENSVKKQLAIAGHRHNGH